MTTFENLTDQTFHSVIGKNVVDQGGEHIGTLDALWTDEETGKVEFLGVKTGWLFGKTHVVPARGVEIHDDRDQIRVPYETQFVKDAPSYPAHEELSDAQEREIYDYYGVGSRGAAVTGGVTTSGVAGRTTTTTGTTATGTNPRGADYVGDVTGTPMVEGATTATGSTTGARAPIGETAVTGTRSEAMPGDRRDVTASEHIEVPLEEERLKVGKREVETGRVRLRKIVRTEQVNVPVELRHEDVVVERIPADQVRAGEGTEMQGNEIDLTLHREEAVVQKERVVTGAVRARRTEEVEQQTVTDSVRKEDVEVDRSAARTDVTRPAVSTTETTETTGTTGTTGLNPLASDREDDRGLRRDGGL